MNKKQLQILIAEGEGLTLEFKEGILQKSTGSLSQWQTLCLLFIVSPHTDDFDDFFIIHDLIK